MHIIILYGSPHEGVTHACIARFKSAIERIEPTTYEEFFLPRDMPDACVGCGACFRKGEDRCPHAARVAPIARALSAADGIVAAAPTYGLDMPGGLKSLFDHLCYRWIPHRVAPEMFHKFGLCVSTTAGAGAGRTVRSLRRQLHYLGVPGTRGKAFALRAMSWDAVKAKARAGIERAMEREASAFVRGVHRARAGRMKPSPYMRFMFWMCSKIVQGYSGGASLDRAHWEGNGWLAGMRPWKRTHAKQRTAPQRPV